MHGATIKIIDNDTSDFIKYREFLG